MGVLGCRQSNPDWQGPAGGSSTGMTSTTTGGVSDDTTSTTTGSESSDGGSGDSGLGLPCGEADACSDAPGAECCTAEPCMGACMIPCESEAECPLDTMGCHHGYCLFPCVSDDDCTAWPSFSCQHGGEFCELD